MKFLPKTRIISRAKNGFALVVTLSLMILLTVIAVGLLSLSTISLRVSGASADMAAARSNARMALMLALGDLQKYAGLDTRVTARADILDANHPPVVGVWKSWEGTNHEESGDKAGRPISPGNYKTTKENRFLTWLTSGDPTAPPSSDTPPTTVKTTSSVTLLGAASVGETAVPATTQIHLAPSRINANDRRGAFAWWVSGENQKARLPKPHQPEDDRAAARWAIFQKSHSIADPKPFGLETLLTDPKPADRVVTLKQSDLIVAGTPRKTPSREFYHDLSTTSTGLLTNTATGGWRKDLSLLTENWEQLPTSGLPFFRVKPGEDIEYNRPTTSNPTPDKAMLYPWSSYRDVAGIKMAIIRQGATSSWQHLQNHMTAYKTLEGTSKSAPGRIDSYSVNNNAISNAAVFNFLHKNRTMPLVARIQWIFSHWAGPPTSLVPGGPPPPAPAGLLEPRLMITPNITLWNPYNVKMKSSGLNFRIPRPIPTALQYGIRKPDDSVIQKQKLRPLSSDGLVNENPAPMVKQGSFVYNIAGPFTLEPGESRVFSPYPYPYPLPDPKKLFQPKEVYEPLTLISGFRLTGGHFAPLRTNDDMKYVLIPSNSQIKILNARFDTEFFESGKNGAQGVGIYMDVNENSDQPRLSYRMIYDKDKANQVWPPITGNSFAESNTLSSLVNNPSPFMYNLFGARVGSKSQVAAKGFVQSSPLSTFTSMGERNDGSAFMADYLGSDHPVNSPFDYNFGLVSGPTDTIVPAENDTGAGYIITGFRADDGLSRCVVAEIPTRPVQSLGELTHWDSRYENPVPPFSFNIIGNSDATPLIGAEEVVNSNVSQLADNLQHDDSYCMNHVLFDDWFVSSLAPDPTDFGDDGKDLKTVCAEFVSGKTPLGNRAYQLIQQDVASASGPDADSFFNKQVNSADAWKTIASRLEVEGMFNVNSTSVTAWRALLGHARNQRVPYQDQSGNSVSLEVSSESDHAVSRLSVAGAPEAKVSGGVFDVENEFAGYRILDDGMIDFLAQEVVKQVRLRGPFLSLAEFVNRQLSSGNLALAGTIQAALNELEGSSESPFKVVSDPDLTKPSGESGDRDPEYQFAAAAVGNSAYGLPGWTRQVDILRPLAPILSARDDTFTIRAYGDARDKNGTTIRARAVCEATVSRSREFLDSADEADILGLPSSPINQLFGRQFKIIAFRWLSSSEI